MAINPVSSVTSLPSIVAPKDTAAVGDKGGLPFGDILGSSLENVDQLQKNADGLAVKAATGDLNDVADYMVSATEASLATDLTVAVRNKAVDAFNEIMRMQI